MTKTEARPRPSDIGSDARSLAEDISEAVNHAHAVATGSVHTHSGSVWKDFRDVVERLAARTPASKVQSPEGIDVHRIHSWADRLLTLLDTPEERDSESVTRVCGELLTLFGLPLDMGDD